MPKERKVKYVSIRFTPELLDEVRELAEQEHRSVNGTVLEAVERYVRSRVKRPASAAGPSGGSGSPAGE